MIADGSSKESHRAENELQRVELFLVLLLKPRYPKPISILRTFFFFFCLCGEKKLTVTCIGLQVAFSVLFLGSLQSAPFSFYASHLLYCPNGFDLDRFSIQLFHVSLVINDGQKYQSSFVDLYSLFFRTLL